ncbi:MAG: M48 family metalloprotease [Elusimicrobia bacterium]|nr:M48 family metalloprotease [Elusimicrobiota bacterium]
MKDAPGVLARSGTRLAIGTLLLASAVAWAQTNGPPAPAREVFWPDSGEECRPVDDPFGVIQPLFQRLVDAAALPTAPLFFFSDEQNSFANSVGGNMPPINRDPEGKVFIGPFLLHVLAQTPDEVAFVLAHEIAHIKFDHSRTRTRRYAEFINHLPDEVRARRHLNDNANSRRRSDREIIKRFDEENAAWLREQEREADREAARLMTRAGFDAAAGAGLLERWGRLDPIRRHGVFHPLNENDPHFERARRVAGTARRIEGGPACRP